MYSTSTCRTTVATYNRCTYALVVLLIVCATYRHVLLFRTTQTTAVTTQLTRKCLVNVQPKSRLRMKPVSKFNVCTVRVYFSDVNHGADGGSSTHCPRQCTSRLFKDHLRRFNSTRFPSTGYWEAVASDCTEGAGDKTPTDGLAPHPYCLKRFHMNFCSFQSNDDIQSTDYVRSCLVERNIKRIVTFGDSNGNRTFQGLLNLISKVLQGAGKCNLVKAERTGMFVDPNYYHLNYSGNTQSYGLHFGVRFCRTCTSRMFRCWYQHHDDRRTTVSHHSEDKQTNGFTLTLEHIAMTRTLDQTIIASNLPSGPVSHTLQYIMRDYFTHDDDLRFPDVIIITFPFIHDVKHRTAADNVTDQQTIRRDIETIFNTVNQFTPPTTQIFWIPSHYVFRYPFDAERVRTYNDVLYDVIRDYVTSTVIDNHHVLFDLFELSCPLRRLTKDPAHMRENWYQTITGHLLQLVCS